MFLPLDPSEVSAALALRHDAGPDLLRIFTCFDNVFELKSLAAPGLRIVGGLVRPGPLTLDPMAPALSVTGNGWTLGDALASLLGEAAELLSQFERQGDLSPTQASLADEGWIKAVAETATGAIDRISGTNLADGSMVTLPADIVLRRTKERRAFEPAGALSSGVAAGVNAAAALERAMLELIERDAAAMWWLGGKPGISLTDASAQKSTELLARLRQGNSSRITTFIDVTTEIGIPVVAACSHDESGRDLAIGIACRRSHEEAADAALRELGQMELSASLAAKKLQASGETTLNEADQRHLQRARFNASDCPLLKPGGDGSIGSTERFTEDTSQAIQQCGHSVVAFDLTRPELGIAVMRAVCAGLQPFSETVSTKRLDAYRRAHGGGEAHHGNALSPF